MSRDLFFVGQRVRVSSCDKRTKLPGTVAESRAMRMVSFSDGRIGPFLTYLVDVDGMPSDNRSGLWAVEEWQLEPIDDGRTVVSWDECAWQPEKVTV